MAAQKCKKKLLVEIVCIAKDLLPQNSTNQDSQLSWFFHTIWKAAIKLKNMGL